MANKYEKFDNEFGLLPAEHENVNISKQKNGGLRSASTTLGTNHLRDHFSDDKCAVEILTPITNCNGNKHLAGEPQSSTGASGAARPPASNFSEFDANNLPKLSFHQQKWRFYLENTWYRLVSIGLIIIYCFLMLYRFAMMLSDPLLDEYFIPIGDFDALLIIYFTVELFFRVYASGSKTSFFSNWYNSLDFVVIILDLLLFLTDIFISEIGTSAHNFFPSVRLVCFGRLVRVYVLINLLRNNERSLLHRPTADECIDQTRTKEQVNIEVVKREDSDNRAMNETDINLETVSTNVINTTNNTSTSKVKRLITPEDFKLDLTYIKDNIIVLPCPVDNLIKFKRNQVKNLEAFLDLKYGSNNYKVFNLCPQQTYMDKSKSRYFHGNYLSFPVEDYGVLSLNAIKDFVINLDTFLNSNAKSVAVIHCSDGKGRTSLVVCAWLLYKKYYSRLEDAQRFFCEQLNQSKSKTTVTEPNASPNLLQTPSQLRYLKYFEQLVSASMQRPKEQCLQLHEIRISCLIGLGQGNGSDLYCVFQINQFEQFHMNFFQENASDQFNTNLNCKTTYNSEQDVLTINPINCPPLVGDILVRFFCRSRSVPKPHQHCAFYFSFNTDFLNDSQTSVYRFDRSQLDNPHEPALHGVYRERFAVELIFKERDS